MRSGKRAASQGKRSTFTWRVKLSLGAALACAALAGGTWYVFGGGRGRAVSTSQGDPVLTRIKGLALPPGTLAIVEAAERFPDDPEAWRMLGLVASAAGETESARECLRRATAIEPRHAKAWYQRALVEEHGDDLTAAIESMRRAIECAPGHPAAHWRLGNWLLDLDDLDGAAAAFDAARRADPSSEQAAIGLARLAELRLDDAAALAALEPFARAGARDPLVDRLYGSTLVRLGRAAEADASFARGTRPPLVPADPWMAEFDQFRADDDALVSMALQYLQNGRAQAAVAILERLWRERPENPSIGCNLAVAIRCDGNPRRSIEILDDLVRRFPKWAKVHHTLALNRRVVAAERGAALDETESRLVMMHLDTAIRLNPAFGQALALKGEILTESGDDRGALECLERAAVAEPANQKWLGQLGDALARSGRLDEAAAVRSRAAALAVPATTPRFTYSAYSPPGGAP